MMNQANVPAQVAPKQHVWMDICATETLLPLSGWNKVLHYFKCMYIYIYIYIYIHTYMHTYSYGGHGDKQQI